jgi:UDP-N-acetyl-D-mannosaminuronic acid dehydrogenase
MSHIIFIISFARTISNSLGIPMHQVKEVEIAELTKIIGKVDMYLQMAFAKDLYLYCQANNVNFPELRDALDTKWNVNILEPKDGIGGPCLPKDTKIFLESSNFKILRAAMEVDKLYREFTAKLEKYTNFTNIER